MPVTPTYPGVYIEEIPSGVRTITGVATSIAAFVGRARRGPVNQAATINGFADFERAFGGLWANSTVSFAVQDFFANGGSQAVVVRLENGATPAKLSLTGNPDNLNLAAADPGTWANGLQASVNHNVSADVASRYGLTEDDLFNLTLTDTATGFTETFLSVSVVAGARQVDRILASQSTLALVDGALPGNRPDEGSASVTTDGGDGNDLEPDDYIGPGLSEAKQGIYALEQADLFNLLCLPPATVGGDTDPTVYDKALDYCVERRAMLIVDPPHDATVSNARTKVQDFGLTGDRARNAAFYFPRVRQANPLMGGQIDDFVPCGLVAGAVARTDAQRGVWKAPAGIDASLNGTAGLTVNLSDAENGELNPLGINCLRSFPVIGRVIWGARTLRGADQLADEYKYVPVRRLALYIEESLYRGTQWVVFEPNDEPLWAQIRLNVGAFMNNLFRQGAFQGTSPRDAYFVKCDKETTTQNDINLGVVNILVGFAPLKPAEFVVIQIQQMAGQVTA